MSTPEAAESDEVKRRILPAVATLIALGAKALKLALLPLTYVALIVPPFIMAVLKLILVENPPNLIPAAGLVTLTVKSTSMVLVVAVADAILIVY